MWSLGHWKLKNHEYFKRKETTNEKKNPLWMLLQNEAVCLSAATCAAGLNTSSISKCVELSEKDLQSERTDTIKK